MFGPRLHAEIEPGQRQGGADVRERLGKLPVLDVTPVHMAMKGVLTGDVADADQLGFESDPYPRMDPQLTLDELTYRPDGRLTVSPRNTYTVRIAPGVQFTRSETALVIGLNDPAEFEATAPVLENDTPPETEQTPDEDETGDVS
jgi:hypothetical protein